MTLHAPLHPQQDVRVRALRESAILDTPREAEFDDLVRLASAICDAPISLISLVDVDRQWFKAKVGVDVDETPLELSVCSHAILQDDLFVVSDTTLDPRTADNPLTVHGLEDGRKMRFYAGAPLIDSNGLPLGTLCVLDTRPRQLADHQKDALRTLARAVMQQIDLRLALRREASARTALEKARLSLEAALDAQKTLLAEIDHRVKNSLAMVAALLRMQGARAASEETREALGQAAQRVGAVATLHQEIYAGGSFDRVSLADFVNRVGALLDQSLPDTVRIVVDVEPVETLYAQASAIASIINEFAANSAKHAFPDGRSGVVAVRGRTTDEGYRIDLEDDGVGLQTHAEGADATKALSSGLGRRLIKAAMAQLGAADVEPAPGQGARLSFIFPLPPASGE